MKRALTFVLAFVLVLSLFGCGGAAQTVHLSFPTAGNG